MEYEKAVNIIEENYGSYSHMIITYLCKEALFMIAKNCLENKQISLSEQTLEKMKNMSDDRQCGYLANPFMQYIIDSYHYNLSYGYEVNNSHENLNMSNNNETLIKSHPLETITEPETDLDNDPDDIGAFGLFD